MNRVTFIFAVAFLVNACAASHITSQDVENAHVVGAAGAAVVERVETVNNAVAAVHAKVHRGIKAHSIPPSLEDVFLKIVEPNPVKRQAHA